jgi:hypothetical protein
MESAAEIPPDTLTMASGNGQGKIRLLSRKALDGRRKEAKQFDAIASAIAKELGEDQLSTVQRHLIEAFAGCVITLQSINAQLLLGGEINVAEQSQAASTLVRLASRIGIERKPRDVTTFGGLVRADQEAERQRLAREQSMSEGVE